MRRAEAALDWLVAQSEGTPFGGLVLHRGQVAAERLAHGFTAETRFEIGSIRKSINSALIGRALARGTLTPGLNAAEAWPDLVAISGDPRDRAITLAMLATGTSGWLAPEGPGERFRYNNAAFTAAERVVARAHGWAGDSILAETRTALVEPLGLSSWHLYHFDRPFDPARFEDPGPKLAVDSNLLDLARWGLLWAEGGGDLIPAEHVVRATRPANPELDACYGWNWYSNAEAAAWPAAARDAFGHGGTATFPDSGTAIRTFLWCCPSLSLVAAIVAIADVGIGRDRLVEPNGIRAGFTARLCAGE
ncbi:serine hydrolase domain-containing protein [Falsiroseomonas sp. HW251]|uniref:serine hydrolase domain-containing protein n=1 Tax=Falsiroseomonas sp. HW251 TaxID=3390998 RepID=UPI003D31FFFC